MTLSASHWQTQCYRQNNDSDTENLLYTEDVSEKKIIQVILIKWEHNPKISQLTWPFLLAEFICIFNSCIISSSFPGE